MMPPPYSGLPPLSYSPTTDLASKQASPIASTSRLPAASKAQGSSRSESTRLQSKCWCGGRGDKRARRAATLATLALVAPLTVAASPLVVPPSRRGAAPLSPRQLSKLPATATLPSTSSSSSSWSDETPSPPSRGLDRAGAAPSGQLIARPTRPPALLQKRVLPKYELVDGEWVLDHAWTLRGRTPHPPSATHDEEAEAAGDPTASARATVLQDNLDDVPESTPSAAVSTRTSLSLVSVADHPSPTPTIDRTPKIAAAASASSTPTASGSNFTIPDGWAATPRETNFYAVPVIVAMSVLVAIAVVGTVVGSVVWRRKARVSRRKHKKGDVEKGRVGRMMEKVGLGTPVAEKTSKGKGKRKKKGGKKGGGGASEVVVHGSTSDLGSGSAGGRRAITRATASALPPAGRLRPRRQRRSRVEDGEQDEEERSALTGSQADQAGVLTPHDTLTSRLQARLRNPLGGSNTAQSQQQGPSTVFSRDLNRTSTHSTYSSTGFGSLSRTSSRTASLRHEAAHETNSLLGQPTDRDALPLGPSLSRTSSRRSMAASIPAPASPALSTHSATSAFGSTVLDVPLPALGPPAYRPASATVQSTTRHSVSRVPVPRIEVEEEEEPRRRSGRARGAPDVEEEQWHWPNEKPVAGPAPRRGRRVPAPVTGAGASSPPPPPSVTEDHEEEAPVDPTLFSAHLATDDKAVLARLREQAAAQSSTSPTAVGSSSSTALAPEASAPVDEDEVDEDGFERLPRHPAASLPAPSAPPPSLLPPPSRPVDLAFDYTTSSPSSASALTLDRKTSRRSPAVEDVDEEAEVGFLPLPVYQSQAQERERERREREVMGRATAPPPDDEEEEEEGEVAERSRERWEGREESAEV